MKVKKHFYLSTNNKLKKIMADKRVYTFGNGLAEGNASMRNLLGGKGANLAERKSLSF